MGPPSGDNQSNSNPSQIIISMARSATGFLLTFLSLLISMQMPCDCGVLSFCSAVNPGARSTRIVIPLCLGEQSFAVSVKTASSRVPFLLSSIRDVTVHEVTVSCNMSIEDTVS